MISVGPTDRQSDMLSRFVATKKQRMRVEMYFDLETTETTKYEIEKKNKAQRPMMRPNGVKKT